MSVGNSKKRLLVIIMIGLIFIAPAYFVASNCFEIGKYIKSSPDRIRGFIRQITRHKNEDHGVCMSVGHSIWREKNSNRTFEFRNNVLMNSPYVVILTNRYGTAPGDYSHEFGLATTMSMGESDDGIDWEKLSVVMDGKPEEKRVFLLENKNYTFEVLPYAAE